MNKKYIYKYQNTSNLTLNSLRRGELFFASRKELNDPSEAAPCYILRGSSELWERLVNLVLFEMIMALGLDKNDIFYKKVYCESYKVKEFVKILRKKQGRSKVIFEDFPSLFRATFLSLYEGLFEKDYLIYLGRSSEKVISLKIIKKVTNNQKYLCSFSLDPLDPIMFGHYGESCKGFVSVFEPEQGKIHISKVDGKFFSPDEDDETGIITLGTSNYTSLDIVPVRYSKNKVLVNAFFDLIHMFFYSEMEDHYDVPLNLPEGATCYSEEKLGFTKDIGWKYEKEIRCFLPRFSNSATPEERTIKFKTSQFKGVVFGPHSSSELQRRVLMAVYFMIKRDQAEENIHPIQDVYFLKAKAKSENYDYDIVPIGKLKAYYSDDDRKLELSLPIDEYKRLNKEDKKKMDIFIEELL